MADTEKKPDPQTPTEIGVVDGIYLLTHKETRLLLNLDQGLADDGTKCEGWRRSYQADFPKMRWSLRRIGGDGAYTLQNLKSETYLNVTGGNKDDGAPVQGWRRPDDIAGQSDQEWIIKAESGGFYRLQCVRTSTYLDLDPASRDDGTLAVASALTEGSRRQFWDLARVSRSGNEIIGILGDWSEGLLPQLRQNYRPEAQYIVIPDDLRKEIWENTGLRTTRLREHVFDYDDFVVKMKDAVATWARDNYNLDGFGVLFGLVYGQSKKGPNAFNWYLTPDMHGLVFFDPQTGQEYTTAALEARGFQPTFAVF